METSVYPCKVCRDDIEFTSCYRAEACPTCRTLHRWEPDFDLGDSDDPRDCSSVIITSVQAELAEYHLYEHILWHVTSPEGCGLPHPCSTRTELERARYRERLKARAIAATASAWAEFLGVPTP